MNLERLGLIVFSHNTRAIRAYKAAGFRKEGLLKRLLFVDGQWVDVAIMAAFRKTKTRFILNSHSIILFLFIHVQFLIFT